jgi:hypothetical protein
MTWIAGATQITVATTRIDFADDADTWRQTGRMPVARRQGCLRSDFFDHADKLMTERSLKSRVAARDFEDRYCRCRTVSPHQCLAVSDGFRNIAD